MLDVFRLAWFAVRTFFGVVALVLSLYAALWLFVKILSAAPGSVDPDAALRRVKAYNALHDQTGGLKTNSPGSSIYENPTSKLTRTREYKAPHFVNRKFDRTGNGMKTSMYRVTDIGSTCVRTSIGSDDDEQLHVAATEIKADRRSSDPTTGLAPGRCSDRRGGAVDQ